MSENSIRLTQYSHGAGCGCKISPKVLETILHSEQAKFVDPNGRLRRLSEIQPRRRYLFLRSGLTRIRGYF